MIHEFTVLVALPNASDDPTVYVDRLYEAGCNDALLGVGQKGFIGMDVSREAETRDQAIESLRENVRTAIPNVKSIMVIGQDA